MTRFSIDMQDLKDLKSCFFQKRFRRCEWTPPFYRSAWALGGFHTRIRAGSPAMVHGEGQALALREGAAFFIVARGPVPRDRSMAREIPARVACEGPRLRDGAAFFHRRAGACHRNVEQFMKHPENNSQRQEEAQKQ